MVIGMLLVWAVLIVGAVWAVGVLFPRGEDRGSAGRERTAREVLDERYARGEISREEYREMLSDLTGREEA